MSQYFRPATINEALSIASEQKGKYTYFSGGTDLQIYRKQMLLENETIIDLNDIVNSDLIHKNGDSLVISAFTSLQDIISSPLVQKHVPLLAEAALSVATPVIRKTATIGGNLLVNNRCTFYNQSQEWRNSIGSCMRDVGEICQVTGGKNKCFSRNVSDTAPSLIALNAVVTIYNQMGNKETPVLNLYAPDGIHFHDGLEQDAILTKITIPIRPQKTWFKKLRLRKAVDFTSLTVAAAVDSSNMARVCLNGISMSPILIEKSLKELTLDQLIRTARKNCKTVDNDLIPLKYRREMIDVFLKEWWDSIPE
ncbi:MAG: FAD binding domain-containing protein [Fidelibacterota bacterium]